ncbi:hypothetical protein P9112_009312 [Eukaryota sp. TZLM1-RC]
MTPTVWLLLPLLTLSIANEVHLVYQFNYTQTILWSDASSWNPYPPTSDSIVYVNGFGRKPILLVDTPPLLHSLHLSNVTLFVDEEDVEIPGKLTCTDSVIESLTDGQVNLTTADFEVPWKTELIKANLVIQEFGHLKDELSLTNSKLLIDEGARVVLDTSDQLLAWGFGGWGRTGTGNTDNPHNTLRVITDEEFVAIAGEVFAFIAGGWSHTLGITSEGTLLAWGNNFHSQLGLGHNKVKHFPTQVSSLSNVVQISAGGYHNLVRLEDDTVWSWGSGWDGQLGHGDTNDQLLPKRIESLSDAIDVSAGYYHSLAVLSDGTVKAWGWGASGALGDGNSSSSVMHPVDVLINIQVKKVEGCFEHSLFITEHNELMTSGANTWGSLCVGDQNHTNIPELIADSSLYRVTQASCGSSYTVFLTEEGDVYSCGRYLGRSPDTIPRHTPGKVEGLSEVRSIVGGLYTVFAVDFNNVLFSWESGDETASPTTETLGYEVVDVYAGWSHYFVTTPSTPCIKSDQNSLLEVNGEVFNDLSTDLFLNSTIHINPNGIVTSDYGGIMLFSFVQNAGFINSFGELYLEYPASLVLSNGEIRSSSLVVNSNDSIITGFGFVNATLVNDGTLNPTGLLHIRHNLILSNESQLVFTNEEGYYGQLYVEEALEVGGFLKVNYTHEALFQGQVFNLISFADRFSDFQDVAIQCEDFFNFNLTLTELDLYVLHNFEGLLNGTCPVLPTDDPIDDPSYDPTQNYTVESILVIISVIVFAFGLWFVIKQFKKNKVSAFKSDPSSLSVLPTAMKPIVSEPSTQPLFQGNLESSNGGRGLGKEVKIEVTQGSQHANSSEVDSKSSPTADQFSRHVVTGRVPASQLRIDEDITYQSNNNVPNFVIDD